MHEQTSDLIYKDIHKTALDARCKIPLLLGNEGYRVDIKIPLSTLGVTAKL